MFLFRRFIVGNGFKGDMGHGLVFKAASNPFFRMGQFIVIIQGGHEPLFG